MLVAALFSAIVSACAATPHPAAPPAATSADHEMALPPGTTRQPLMIDGRRRMFLLHQPTTPTSGRPQALVVMIHGGGGSARGAEARYGWDALADRAGFTVAYPDGIGRSWNETSGCCGPAARLGVNDVAFITSMISAVQAITPVDPNRVYATGISLGGIMAYQLACTTDLFAAIGPDSATQLGRCPTPQPISLIHIHGGADQRIRYDGQPGMGVNRITGGRSIPDLVASWRGIDNCGPPTASTAGPLHTTTAHCPDNRAVVLIMIDGAGHQWPGSLPGQPRRLKAISPDPPSTALDATTTIWTFFNAHPRSR